MNTIEGNINQKLQVEQQEVVQQDVIQPEEV